MVESVQKAGADMKVETVDASHSPFTVYPRGWRGRLDGRLVNPYDMCLWVWVVRVFAREYSA